MPTLIPSPRQRSRFAFDFQPEVCRGSLDFSLDAATGHAATFSRSSVTSADDSNGDAYTVGYGRPRLQWGTLDFDDDVTTLGVHLGREALSFPFNKKPTPLTVYTRFRKMGGDVSGAVVIAIGGTSGGRLVIAESAASGYTATYHNGTNAYTSTVTTRLLVGDAVELRCVLTSSSLTLYQSVAGAIEEQGSASGALTLGASWNANLLYLGANAGSNPASIIVARACVALGSLAISAFRPAQRTGYTQPASVNRITEAGDPRVTEASDRLLTEGT